MYYLHSFDIMNKTKTFRILLYNFGGNTNDERKEKGIWFEFSERFSLGICFSVDEGGTAAVYVHSSGFSALYGRSNFSDYHREMLSHSPAAEKAHSFVLCIRRSWLYGLYDYL